MGDVRSRLDAERRANELPEGRSPVRTTNQLVGRALPTQSVRELSERRASEEHGDQIVLLDKSRSGAGALTSGGGYNSSVRTRTIIDSAKAGEQASPEAHSSVIANAYYDAEMKRRAEEEAQRRADLASGRLKYV